MKKRTLKSLPNRMPEERLSLSNISEAIHIETGFSRANIKEIIQSLGNFTLSSMKEGKSVLLPKIGTIYPTVKPGKNVVNMNRHNDKPTELMYMPSRWVLKFKPLHSSAKEMLKIEPTEEQINNIYRD